MTDEELKRLEALCKKLDSAGSDHAGLLVVGTAAAALPAALAEIRRLRGLVKEAEWSNGIECFHCNAWVPDSPKHDADCPAFTPDGEVK